MINKTLQTIRKRNLLGRRMHIVIGLSGGPDSVCLFDVLYRLSAEMEWKLYAVHVNHKLRPGAAEEDQEYVEKLCEERGVPCRVFTGDCNALAAEQGMTSEEAGRKLRYDSYAAAADELVQRGVPKERIAIALAHNANDQCETVLFRMLRGSGTDGLAGIAYKRYDENGYAIVRPILDASRAEIENYCAERGLCPRIDHTNSESVYTRNKIRNLLIPYLEENFNGGVTETVNRLAKVATCDRDYLRSVSAAAYEETRIAGVGEGHAGVGKGRDGSAANADGTGRAGSAARQEALCVSKTRALHKAIRTRLYSLALGKLGMKENLSYNQLELVDALLFSEKPSAAASLSEGYTARREYDKLIFAKGSTAGRESGNASGLSEAARQSGNGSSLPEAGRRSVNPVGQAAAITVGTAAGSSAAAASRAEAARQSISAASQAEAARQSVNPVGQAAIAVGAEDRPNVGAEDLSFAGGWRLRRMSGAEYAEYKKGGGLHGAFCGLSPQEEAALAVRTRRAGDTLDIGGGRKKLQDLFVDEKLPRQYRDEALVLAAGAEVLWVLPWEKYPREIMRRKGRFSAGHKVGSEKTDFVIVLEKL